MIKTVLSLFAAVTLTVWGIDERLETREVAAFDTIELSGAFEVLLVKAEKPAVKIEVRGDDELDDILTEVRGQALRIVNDRRRYNYTGSNKTILTIYYQQINRLVARGAYRLRSEQKLVGDRLDIELKGAGDTYLEVDLQRLTAQVDGTGSTELAGRSRYQLIELSGVGNYRGYRLASDTAEVHMNGIGSLEVNVAHHLQADAQGIGSVRYRGNPGQVKIRSTLLGTIKPAQD
ncbi:MAG: DUF2807 domain-containing protein [Bernardetiaceae bacterium]|jgi:hypothetical protein|nr:DUF2807 domain-containing protein [Bernardetiaceae bacterium]